jgi:hypothetical protein
VFIPNENCHREKSLQNDFVICHPKAMASQAQQYRSFLEEFNGALINPAFEVRDSSMSAPDYSRTVPENLVQALWRGQFFRPDSLKLTNGKDIIILDPGRFQTAGPGPDFRSAQLVIGGVEQVGDVEIHTDAISWIRHGHDRDFEYNGVILHVALTQTDQKTSDALQNGWSCPRLILEPYLEPNLESALAQARELLFSESQSADHHPQCPGARACQNAVLSMGLPRIRQLIASAADARLEQRLERLSLSARDQTPSQILHQSLMMALGQKAAKTLYFLLARRVPLEELQTTCQDFAPEEIPLAFEAVLLGVAGLLPSPQEALKADWDDETRDYHALLSGLWNQQRKWYRDRVLPPTRRWYGMIRPPGFPCRRLAAYTQLLARQATLHSLIQSAQKQLHELRSLPRQTRTDWKKLFRLMISWFDIPEHKYWSRRYTWGGKLLDKPVAILGADQAKSLLLNGLLPSTMSYARTTGDEDLQDFLTESYRQFPALASNEITRHMVLKLFGGETPPEIPLHLERYQQGLLQIFADCCQVPEFGVCQIQSSIG